MPAYYEINEAVLRNMPNSAVVLDAGCGSGIIGKYMKPKNNIICGLDYDRDAVKAAGKYLDKAAFFDLENGKKIPFSRKFDVILFNGVLEHLKDPVSVVKRFRKYLAPSGIFIISLPNVACWTVRFRLLFGDFTYTETGILDKTHLHLYTLKTAREFIEKECGLEIIKTDITPSLVRGIYPLLIMPFFRKGKANSHDVHAAVLESRPYSAYRKFLLPLETAVAKLWKGLFAYELVYVAKVPQTA